MYDVDNLNWEGAGQHGGSKRCTFPRADSTAGSLCKDAAIQRGSRRTDPVRRHAPSPRARSGPDDSRLYHSVVRQDPGHKTPSPNRQHSVSASTRTTISSDVSSHSMPFSGDPTTPYGMRNGTKCASRFQR